MCGNGCVFRDEDTIIHCYRRIQIASVLTDRFFCWTWEAPRKQKLYFHSKLQTQTTALVQYMNTLFKKQIKCHSCEGTCCLRSLGTVHSEALVSKIDLPSIKERYKSPHNGPSTSGHLLTLSIFQFLKHLRVFKAFPLPLSIYGLPALTSRSGWSRWDLQHALKQTVGSFRQKIEGWGKYKKWKGSWVYSHTL